MSDVGYGTCSLCQEAGLPARIHIDELVEHLYSVHGTTVDILTWPDGEPVVFDRTLEPDDFREDDGNT